MKRVFKYFILPIILIPVYLLLGLLPNIFNPHNTKNISELVFSLIPIISIFIGVVFVLIQLILSFLIRASLLRVFSSFCISFFLIGYLFNILRWPGSTLSIRSGYIVLFLTILLFVLQKLRNRNNLKSN